MIDLPLPFSPPPSSTPPLPRVSAFLCVTLFLALEEGRDGGTTCDDDEE